MLKNKNHHFTLIEIIIFVGILLLFLLIFPGIIKAITADMNKEQICWDNLKKLYQVFINYSNSYQGCLPVKINQSGGKTPWIYVVAKTYPEEFKGKLWSKPTGRRFWHCPACPLNNWKDSCPGGASDYGLNSMAFTAPGKKNTCKFKNSAPKPGEKFLLADAPLTKFRPYILPIKYLSISYRHDLKGNYLFFDGHITAYTRKQVFRWGEDDWTAFKSAADQKPWNCDIHTLKKTK